MTSRAGGNGPGPRDVVPPPPCCPAPDTPPPAAGPLRKTVRVVNPLGLHWRIAERFSRSAQRYACAVRVWHGESRADGKSPTDLILLVALPGAELVVEVDGADAAAALDALADILAAAGGEDYTI
ncbi:MAG: hypothetical protein C0501_09910 [Isosphaera sp.]|nr:hypothetical protein [Isosphaera sp.]